MAAAGVLASAGTAIVVGAATSCSIRRSAPPCARRSCSPTWPAARTPGGAARPAASGPLFAAAGLLFALTSLNALAAPLAFTLGRVAYAVVMFALVYVF